MALSESRWHHGVLRTHRHRLVLGWAKSGFLVPQHMESSSFLLWLWCWWNYQLRLLPDEFPSTADVKAQQKNTPEAFPTSDFGSNKEHTLISSRASSLGSTNPFDVFSYLQNTVTLKSPSSSTLWQSLTCVCGGVGGGEGKERADTGTEQMERGPQRRKERGSEGHREPEILAGQKLRTWRREGHRAGKISWGVVTQGRPARHCHRQERKREETGQGREEPEDTQRTGGREEGSTWVSCGLWFVWRSNTDTLLGFKLRVLSSNI